jgi:hypothetical protein
MHDKILSAREMHQILRKWPIFLSREIQVTFSYGINTEQMGYDKQATGKQCQR